MSAQSAGRTFVAPGKLMLAGEYSVLGPGGLALAVAVHPGLQATVGAASRWELARAESRDCWTEGAPVPPALRFAEAALAEAQLAQAAPLAPHRLTTGALGQASRGKRKVGLGGSASATVVISAALMGLRGQDPAAHQREILELALRAHGRAQQGRGSGYDVATVSLGGLVLWDREQRRAEQLRWPAGLHLLAGYSGQSASTTGLLRRLEAQAGPELEQELRALSHGVAELALALKSGDQTEVLAGMRSCHQRLAAWERRYDLGVVTPAIQQLIGLAEELGAGAKVSGAGGGDSVIALCLSAEQRAALAAAWQRAGFEPLAVTLDLEGTKEVIAAPGDDRH